MKQQDTLVGFEHLTGIHQLHVNAPHQPLCHADQLHVNAPHQPLCHTAQLHVNAPTTMPCGPVTC